MTAYPKPLPSAAGLAAEFHAFCSRGELRFQRCRACDAWRHVPRELCSECGSTAFEWAASSGRGRVFTWTVVERALHPAFSSETPYAPVVIDMDEGVRIVSQIVDCAPDELAIDMPVEVTFEQAHDDGVTLPKFRRVAG